MRLSPMSFGTSGSTTSGSTSTPATFGASGSGSVSGSSGTSIIVQGLSVCNIWVFDRMGRSPVPFTTSSGPSGLTINANFVTGLKYHIGVIK
jgi:hypothetical protein